MIRGVQEIQTVARLPNFHATSRYHTSVKGQLLPGVTLYQNQILTWSYKVIH